MGASARTVTATRAAAASSASRAAAAGLALACLAVLPCALTGARAAAADGTAGLEACRDIAADDARLACYDREVRNLAAPTFSGRLSKTTDRFHIGEPTLLRYQSDGAIFVLYLKSSDDAVVQNLHIGGGGEASYLIDQPGTYYLDVSGSESWRIWLEPQRHPKTN